jgi:hypothetical protein
VFIDAEIPDRKTKNFLFSNHGWYRKEHYEQRIQLFNMNFLTRKSQLNKQFTDWQTSLLRQVLSKMYHGVADWQQSIQKKISKLFLEVFFWIHKHHKDLRHVNLIFHEQTCKCYERSQFKTIQTKFVSSFKRGWSGATTWILWVDFRSISIRPNFLDRSRIPNKLSCQQIQLCLLKWQKSILYHEIRAQCVTSDCPRRNMVKRCCLTIFLKVMLHQKTTWKCCRTISSHNFKNIQSFN